MKCKNLTCENIRITNGFWKKKQDLIRNVTVWNVYKRFSETGRFAALKLNWKEGDPNKPHIFWDSDVAKWIEGVAYLTLKQREPKLEAIVDDIVNDIARGRMADGYFNSYYQQIEPQNRFTVRANHELYCAGHLLEAAIAYDKATGKSKFLSLMKDYIALIKKVFMDENAAAFEAPGHEEIELALIKLYDYTKEPQYLELALHFVNKRGTKGKENQGWASPDRSAEQDHMPVREQTEAVGHAVRAVYLYCAMADLALRENDPALTAACKRLFENVTEQKMYITGAIGSTKRGEAFEESFLLPNDTAYAETCAALGLALWARRMALLEPDNSRYADTAERVIYNGFLSGMSLDGKSFFYENAQEIDLEARKRAAAYGSVKHFPITQRVEVFSCSCCPPNVVRFIPSIADFLYHYTDSTVYIDQYMESEAHFEDCSIVQKTEYPYRGTVSVSVTGKTKQLAFRIPAWCKHFTLCKNEMPISAKPNRGYVLTEGADGDTFTLELCMQVRHIKADRRIRDNRGSVALTYGPFVMCMEGVDNGEKLYEVALAGRQAEVQFDSRLNLPTVHCPAVRIKTAALYSEETESTTFTAKWIPYFAFANRGETDMRIWVENT